MRFHPETLWGHWGRRARPLVGGGGGRRRNSEERRGGQSPGEVGSFSSITCPWRTQERPGSFLAKAADRKSVHDFASKAASEANSCCGDEVQGRLTDDHQMEKGCRQRERRGIWEPRPPTLLHFHPKRPPNSRRAGEGQRQQLLRWRWERGDSDRGRARRLLCMSLPEQEVGTLPRGPLSSKPGLEVTGTSYRFLGVGIGLGGGGRSFKPPSLAPLAADRSWPLGRSPNGFGKTTRLLSGVR